MFLLICWPLTSNVAVSRWQHLWTFWNAYERIDLQCAYRVSVSDKCVCQRMLKLMQRGIAAWFLLICWPLTSKVGVSRWQHLWTFWNAYERIDWQCAYRVSVSDKCVCQRMLKLMQRGIAAWFLLICWPLTSKVAVSRWQHLWTFWNAYERIDLQCAYRVSVSDKCVCQRMLKLMQRGIAAWFLLIWWPLTSKVAVSRWQHLWTFWNAYERIDLQCAYRVSVSDKCVCQRMLKLMQRGIAAWFLLICWPLTSKVAVSRWQHLWAYEKIDTWQFSYRISPFGFWVCQRGFLLAQRGIALLTLVFGRVFLFPTCYPCKWNFTNDRNTGQR